MRYSYTKPTRNSDLLHQEVAALGLPGFMGILTSGDTVLVEFSGVLTPAQQAQVTVVVTAHTGKSRRRRSGAAIAADVLAWIDTPPTTAGKLTRLAKVASRCAAMLLRMEPGALRREGVPVDGDEDEPAPPAVSGGI